MDTEGMCGMNWEIGTDVCAMPSVKQLAGTCCIRQGA